MCVRPGPTFSCARRCGRSGGESLGITSLALLDTVGLSLGLYIALVLRSFVFGDPVLWSLLWRTESEEWLPFLIPITLLVFWQAGLYATRERRAGLGRVASSLLLVALIVLAFGYGTGYDFNTTGLIPTALVVCAITIGLLRAAYDSFTLELQRLLHARKRALLLGTGQSLATLRRHALRQTGRDRVRVRRRACRRSGSGARRAHRADPAGRGDPQRGRLRRGGRARDRRDGASGGREGADRAEDDRPAAPARRVRPRPGDAALRAAPACACRDGLGREEGVRPRGQLLVVLVGLPVWLLIALAIRLDSRGPVLYRDRRVGVGEREFGMLKFRTMVEGAAELQDELEDRNEAEGALFKIREDPRLTRVGRVLRRLSLDELPQVLNVLGGEMSLVGPRPLPVRDYQLLEAWHRKRYNVLPGITGLWQISGRSSLTFDDLVRLDFYYIENWSIWLDISILVKTLLAVIAVAAPTTPRATSAGSSRPSR